MSETSNLYFLQQQMARAIMRPLHGESMQEQWLDGSSMLRVAAEFIKPNKRLNSFQRLEIYNQQYWFRLLESLQDDFPALNTILGGERFDALAVAYLSRYPSRSYTLNQLGEHLAKFILEEPSFTDKSQKLAYETACLEWAEMVAFSAEAKPPLDQVDLQTANPAELVLHMQPHISFLELSYALDNFLLQLDKNPHKSVESNAFIARAKQLNKISRPRKQHNYLAVYKLNDSVYYKRLTEDQFILLKSLQKGLTLTAACSELLSSLNNSSGASDLPRKLQKYFADWTELGWFSKCL